MEDNSCVREDGRAFGCKWVEEDWLFSCGRGLLLLFDQGTIMTKPVAPST